MKLPKVWGPFDPLASAPGISKSNSLEIINAPFLTASGPGFVTHKKDGFTKILLSGESSPGPYLWVVARRITAGQEIESFNLLCRPETREAVEFVTNTNNRGVLLDPLKPSLRKPLRGFGTLGNGVGFILGVRIGAGWALSTTGDGLNVWPVLITFEDVSKNFIPVLDAEIVGSVSEGPFLRTTHEFTNLCALGWNAASESYAWAAGYLTSRDLPPVSDRFTHSRVFLAQDVIPMPGECAGYNQIYPTVSQDVVDSLTYITSSEIEHGVYYGGLDGGATKSTFHNSVTDPDGAGRAYPYYTTGGVPYCVGPGRLMATVFRIGGGPVPNTATQSDPVVIHLDNNIFSYNGSGGIQCQGVVFHGTDSTKSNENATYDTDLEFAARIKSTRDFYPLLQSFVAFSDDSGATWTRNSLHDVFGFDLAPVVRTEFEEFSGMASAQMTLMGRAYWACYIGEGKSLAFFPGVDDYVSGMPDAELLQRPTVACFLLEGRTSTRLPWPGDAPGVAAAASSTRVQPGSFGVGCYTCMAVGGEMISTVDFGATWTTSTRALPNADFINPDRRPIVPAFVRHCTTKRAAGTTSIASHAKAMLVVPGVAIAQPAGSDSKLKLSEVTVLASTESFGTLFTNGGVAVPHKESALWPPTTVDRVGAPTEAVYYGEPGNRNSPRPELGTEFDKPKKPT